jgi:hypothetical protein
MKHSRTALAIAVGVAAGVTVVAVAAVAQSGSAHSASRTSTASGDSAELQALAQLQGVTANPSASSSPSGSHGQRGPLVRGPGGFGGGLLGGQILHGTVVVKGPDGKLVDVTIQRGSVTSVGGGKFVVRSNDGFVETWSMDSATHYLLPGVGRGPWMAKPGSSASPSPSSSPSASSVAKGLNVLVLGRSTGSNTGTARLVVTVLDVAGDGPGRWGPGWMGPMPGMHDRFGDRFGGPDHLRPGMPAQAPKSAPSPSPTAHA